MVDLKKINIPSIPKVNVDTKKMMGAVDGMVDRIPPQVASLLKKISIALLVFFILMGIYYGWTKGWEGATPQGMQLASDTRSLFAMEIETEYNRSRKDVRMSDPDDVKFDTNRRMEFEFVSEREVENIESKPAPEENDFLGKEYDFRNRKSESTSTPPLATPSGDGLLSSPIHVESIGAWENTDTLQEIGAVNQLERKNTDLSSKKQSKSPSGISSLPDSESEDDLRFNKLMDRLEKLDKKIAEKNKKSNDHTVTKEDPALEKLDEPTAPKKQRALEPLRR